MPALVVLDTNALILPFERRVRIEAELERLLGPFQGLVPSPCLLELERIAKEESGARRDRAKMARQFADRFERVAAEGRADEAALRVAKERSAHLFTNDLELIRLAKADKVPVIRLKGLSHLVFAEHNTNND
jgi:uncharacterized protein